MKLSLICCKERPPSALFVPVFCSAKSLSNVQKCSPNRPKAHYTVSQTRRFFWNSLENIDSLIGPLLHLELNDLSQSQGSLIPFALVSHQFIRRPRIFALSTHTKFMTIMMTHHYAKLNANIVTISLFWCHMSVTI